jgi:Uma2 family endonuclease
MSAVATPLQTPLVPITLPGSGVSPRPWRWTREQYYKLGELGLLKGKRVELIRGEIFEMSPINWSHTVGTTKIADALRQAFASQAWINIQNTLATDDSDPQPDVAVIPGQIENYSDHPRTALLVVEVADTTLFYDTTTKAELYATARIAEYWVLDLENRKLLVFRNPVQLPAGLGASAYQTQFILNPTDTIAPLATPNHIITVSDFLP